MENKNSETVATMMTIDDAQRVIENMTDEELKGDRPIEIICSYNGKLNREKLIEAYYRTAKIKQIAMTIGSIRKYVKAMDADRAAAAKEAAAAAKKEAADDVDDTDDYNNGNSEQNGKNNEGYTVDGNTLGCDDIKNIKLFAGKYQITTKDGIVWCPNSDKEMTICPNAVLITGRYIDPKTKNVMVKISYYVGGSWGMVIVDRKIVANGHALTEELASKGVSINESNAKQISDFLKMIEHWNIRSLPIGRAVNVLGWADKDCTTFVPFHDDATFVGDDDIQQLFDAIHEHGDFDEWKKQVCKLRKTSVVGRIVMASSFASVLLEPLGQNPYFVSLWGGSDTGKTVLLRLAASVYADPAHYLLNFNSTRNALEAKIAFLRSTTACIDEQMTAVTNGTKDMAGLVYDVSEGESRGRSKKDGSARKTYQFRNTVIVTGEQPLIRDSANDGAKNRVIEIRIKEPILPHDQLTELHFAAMENYGFAGKAFVNAVIAQKDTLKERFTEYTECFRRMGVESKHAMIGATILLADRLSYGFFEDELALSPEDLLPYLRKADEASMAENIVADIYGVIAANINRFDVPEECRNVTSWGTIKDGYYCINKPTFKQMARDMGFNPQLVRAFLVDNKLTWSTGKQNDFVVEINGVSTRTIAFKIDPPFLRGEEDSKSA